MRGHLPSTSWPAVVNLATSGPENQNDRLELTSDPNYRVPTPGSRLSQVQPAHSRALRRDPESSMGTAVHRPPPGPPKITSGPEAEIGRSRARVIPGRSPPLGEGGPSEHPARCERAPGGRGPQGRARDQHEGGQRGSVRRRRAPGGRPCPRALPRQHTHAVLGAWRPFNVAAPGRPHPPVRPARQCKEIEENNRMGKTRDFFKKIRDTKGTFHAKMGSITKEMVWT